VVHAERFDHILRVARLSREIAAAHQLDTGRTYLAGILHDIARDLPEEELLRLAPPECAIDADHPLALHGRAGRVLLERWGYSDPVVLTAVEQHTTGPLPDQPVAVAVYISDVSEPGRGVNEEIRRLAFCDLRGALELAICSKVHYLQGRGISVHPRTMSVYRALTERTC
jgi:predicted HD superfamily hydrolase involved in NAD metabolism